MTATRDRTAWINGGKARCVVPAQRRPEAKRLVLLGAPGIGKGTQAELLCEGLGTCHLSTGDVFRATKCLEAAERGPALESAFGYMRRGDLVPDEIVLDLVRERARCLRCQGGFLLDGFPRTVAQAEALAQMLKAQSVALHAVLSYALPLDQVVTRLSGRRPCSGCKAVFHLRSRPPHVEGVCDHCGGRLYQREDDQPSAIKVRLRAYDESTAPLIDFYRSMVCYTPFWRKVHRKRFIVGQWPHSMDDGDRTVEPGFRLANPYHQNSSSMGQRRVNSH